MHILGISLGLVALLASQATAQPSTNTDDLYSDYDYCQGITPIAYKTYKPLVQYSTSCPCCLFYQPQQFIAQTIFTILNISLAHTSFHPPSQRD